MRPPVVLFRLLGQLGGVDGDHQLLIGGDEQHLHLGVGGGDHSLLAPDVVGGLVQLQAHEVQALADHGPDGLVVLAHAGGEDDGVRSAHGGGVSAHILADLIGELLLRQRGLLVARQVLEEAGLDGLEARYATYDRQWEALADSLAAERGLLRSSGSDFHGDRKPNRLGEGLGQLFVPVAWAEKPEN